MATYLKLIICILFPFVVAIAMPANNPEYFPQEDTFDFNSERLDGRFTGGFGEQTCHSCHFDYDINMPGGSLSMDGLPSAYTPGNEYEVTVTVESERLENGGFQMTSRFEDGSQAGSFSWEGNRLKFTPGISDEVQYLQHTHEGTRPTATREVSWNFTWTAPESPDGKVIFNIAANAGNDDDSSFDDWIYVDELTSNPGK
jgi:hypothetical protein